MSVRFAFSALLAVFFLFLGVSCKREENKDVRLEDGSSDSYHLGPNETSVGEGAGITFTTTGPWTATLTVGEQTIGDSEVPDSGDDIPERTLASLFTTILVPISSLFIGNWLLQDWSVS